MTKKEAMAEFQCDGMCDCGEYAIGVIRYINSNRVEIFSPSCGPCNDPILEAEWLKLT